MNTPKLNEIFSTVSNSISRLKKLDEQLSDGATGLTKKERLNLEREQTKLYTLSLHVRSCALVEERQSHSSSW